MKTDTPYQDAFEQALIDLSKVMEKREALELDVFNVDRQVVLYREAVMSLANLCGKDVKEVTSEHPELFPDMIDPDIGLTDAVRKALQSMSAMSLSPIQVRNRMDHLHFDLSPYKNVLASIHTILKRLKAKGEITSRERDGKTVYRWQGPPHNQVVIRGGSLKSS
jgi:hypothetical protein